jgi:hypothetical protein
LRCDEFNFTSPASTILHGIDDHMALRGSALNHKVSTEPRCAGDASVARIFDVLA